MALSTNALVTLVQAKTYLRVDAAAHLHVEAEYVGMGDSSQIHFALGNVPLEGSLKLYVNGELQTETTHYSMTELLITFVDAPTVLPITASYIYSSAVGGAGYHEHEELVGIGDNIVTEFTLDETPIEGSLRLYVDADLQVDPTDYGIVGVTITFVTAPHNKDIITALYNHSVGEGGDVFESYEDELLENLIEAATKKAEDYTGRVFIQREIEETHIGNNKQVLVLNKRPVVSVGDITVGGDGLASYTERLTIGRIYHPVVWPLDYEVVVTYTAGYDTDRAVTQGLVPEAVSAVLLILANLFENRVDRVKSESIAGLGEVTYEINSKARELLQPLMVNVI